MRASMLPSVFALSLGLLGLIGETTAHAEMVMVANYVATERRPSRINPVRNGGTVCTQEVKACADGTYVSRNPANECKFKSCPVKTALN